MQEREAMINSRIKRIKGSNLNRSDTQSINELIDRVNKLSNIKFNRATSVRSTARGISVNVGGSSSTNESYNTISVCNQSGITLYKYGFYQIDGYDDDEEKWKVIRPNQYNQASNLCILTKTLAPAVGTTYDSCLAYVNGVYSLNVVSSYDAGTIVGNGYVGMFAFYGTESYGGWKVIKMLDDDPPSGSGALARVQYVGPQGVLGGRINSQDTDKGVGWYTVAPQFYKYTSGETGSWSNCPGTGYVSAYMETEDGNTTHSLDGFDRVEILKWVETDEGEDNYYMIRPLYAGIII